MLRKDRPGVRPVEAVSMLLAHHLGTRYTGPHRPRHLGARVLKLGRTPGRPQSHVLLDAFRKEGIMARSIEVCGR